MGQRQEKPESMQGSGISCFIQKVFTKHLLQKFLYFDENNVFLSEYLIIISCIEAHVIVTLQ